MCHRHRGTLVVRPSRSRRHRSAAMGVGKVHSPVRDAVVERVRRKHRITIAQLAAHCQSNSTYSKTYSQRRIAARTELATRQQLALWLTKNTQLLPPLPDIVDLAHAFHVHQWCTQHGITDASDLRRVYGGGGNASLMQTLLAPLTRGEDRADQRRILNTLDSAAPGQIHCLDAPPGTGKTWLMGALMLTVHCGRRVVTYVAPQHRQVNAMRSDTGGRGQSPVYGQCTTLDRYVATHFMRSEINIIQTMRYISEPDVTFEQALVFIYQLVSAFQTKLMHAVLIVDEYATINPLILVVLMVCARLRGFVLVLAGDRCQQSPIGQRPWHSQSNYALACALVPAERRHQLTVSIRSGGDSDLTRRLNRVRDMIDANQATPTTPERMYTLYGLFRDQFHCPPDPLRRGYIAECNAAITQRVDTAMSCAESSGVVCRRAPITSGHQPCDVTQNGDGPRRFPVYVPLIAGWIYRHGTDRRLVRLDNIDTMQATDMQTGEQLVVNIQDAAESLTPQHMSELQPTSPPPQCYPLVPMVSTAYMAQGMTVPPQISIDIDMNQRTMQSLYVSLSRVTSMTQLGALYTPHLGSLVETERRNDGYLYNVPLVHRRRQCVGDNMVFETVSRLPVWNTRRAVRVRLGGSTGGSDDDTAPDTRLTRFVKRCCTARAAFVFQPGLQNDTFLQYAAQLMDGVV